MILPRRGESVRQKIIVVAVLIFSKATGSFETCFAGLRSAHLIFRNFAAGERLVLVRCLVSSSSRIRRTAVAARTFATGLSLPPAAFGRPQVRQRSHFCAATATAVGAVVVLAGVVSAPAVVVVVVVVYCCCGC